MEMQLPCSNTKFLQNSEQPAGSGSAKGSRLPKDTREVLNSASSPLRATQKPDVSVVA